jgi:hypothetical protein
MPDAVLRPAIVSSLMRDDNEQEDTPMIKDLEATINIEAPQLGAHILGLVETVVLPPWMLELIKLIVLNILAAALAGEAGLGPIAAEILKGL